MCVRKQSYNILITIHAPFVNFDAILSVQITQIISEPLAT